MSPSNWPRHRGAAACLITSVACALVLLAGCAAPGPYGRPGELSPRLGDEIVVAGQFFHTGTPVVLWLDPGGYDAYRAECKFDPNQLRPSKPVSDSPIRYSTFRRGLPEDVAARVREEGWDLSTLQAHVDQFVYHYDVCGTSRKCFDVLHDRRGLSVHFMLDLDGTIYQTLDAKERAWHAGQANDRSVGIEIANIGAYRDMKVLDQWYGQDDAGRTIVTLPADFGPTGIRTPNFVARPSREGVVEGVIHGRTLYQYDLTDEQYDALIRLTATLCQALPGIRPDAPRDAAGNVRMDELSDQELAEFSGLLGHYHITKDKVDPGPAFDWERVIAGVRKLLRP